jgi:hypothetical protein
MSARSTQERPHSLALRDSGWAVLHRVLCPLCNLDKANFVLDGVPIDGHRELRHAVDLGWAYFIIPETGHGNRHGFKKAFGLYVDGVQQAMAVVIGDPAAGGHATHYTATIRCLFAY